MKKIPLSKGQYALVDDDFVVEHKYYAHWYPSIQSFYAERMVPVNGKQKKQGLAHDVLGVKRWELRDKGLVVDHINHDTLDNRRENLRLVTRSQNGFNQKPQKNTSSKYKGVTWYKAIGKWHTQIQVANVRYHLGYYVNEHDAAYVYNAAAKVLFQQYALLNDITGAVTDDRLRCKHFINKIQKQIIEDVLSENNKFEGGYTQKQPEKASLPILEKHETETPNNIHTSTEQGKIVCSTGEKKLWQKK